jgi:type I restriction enzyme M protein
MENDAEKIGGRSWFVDIETVKNKNYDLKAVNPNIKEKDLPKPDKLIKIIEESQEKINESLKKPREIEEHAPNRNRVRMNSAPDL